ncbi:hypothetical protein D3C87_1921250 [compost metagenome]
MDVGAQIRAGLPLLRRTTGLHVLEGSGADRYLRYRLLPGADLHRERYRNGAVSRGKIAVPFHPADASGYGDFVQQRTRHARQLHRHELVRLPSKR